MWLVGRSTRVASVLAVGAFVAATFASASRAGPAASTAATPSHLYWTNSATSRGPSGPAIDTVARADLNGSNVNRDHPLASFEEE